MVKKILLLGLLAAGLYANEMETVDVKVCIDTTKNADKSFNQMKEMLVSMAQDEGYNSLYKKALGEENKNALTDHHRKDLSVKVNDMLDEGNNFCNNSTISIKKERLQYYLPQKVSKDRICHKDGNLSPTKLKEAAALKGYKALISEITDKEISDELAKKLVHNYQRDDGKMYMAQGAYCFGASGMVIPFEVENGMISSNETTKTTKNAFQYVFDYSKYEIGDSVEPYSNKLIINNKRSISYITGTSKKASSFELDQLNLSGNFTVEVIADWNNFSQSIILESPKGEDIMLTFLKDDIIFGTHRQGWEKHGAWIGGDEANRLKLVKKGKKIKAYINDVFFAGVNVDPKTMFSKLTINGIDNNDYLYDVRVNSIKEAGNVKSFELNLNKYDIGDIPSLYSNNMIVKKNKNKRYLSGRAKSSQLNIPNLSLRDNFKVEVSLDWNGNDSESIILESPNGKDIAFKMLKGDLTFGTQKKNWERTGSWKGGAKANRVKLVKKGKKVKAYINDVFFAGVNVDPNTIFSKLIINGFKNNDYLYDVVIK